MFKNKESTATFEQHSINVKKKRHKIDNIEFKFITKVDLVIS
jgi:hypothetical protein